MLLLCIFTKYMSYVAYPLTTTSSIGFNLNTHPLGQTQCDCNCDIVHLRVVSFPPNFKDFYLLPKHSMHANSDAAFQACAGKCLLNDFQRHVTRFLFWLCVWQKIKPIFVTVYNTIYMYRISWWTCFVCLRGKFQLINDKYFFVDKACL